MPSVEWRHEADVPPVGPGGDGSTRADEEPGSRPHDEPPPVVHPPAAGPSLHARGEPDPRADRHLRRGGAPDRRRDGEAQDPGLIGTCVTGPPRRRRLRPTTAIPGALRRSENGLHPDRWRPFDVDIDATIAILVQAPAGTARRMGRW